jgi:hypothetical protein
MPTDTAGSVTLILRGLREGDVEKVTPLWERYFGRLTRLAAKRLRSAPTGLRGYEEDDALSAINDFCDGIARGKFDYVDRREVLWVILARITERKALGRLRDGRGREPVLPADRRPAGSSDGDCCCTRQVVVERTQDCADAVRLELNEVIESLENPLWREAVRMKLEGYTVREIAERLGRGESCVRVWFRTIRAIWEDSYGRENLLG